MNRGKDNAPERAMWLLLVAIIATCMIMAAGTCSGQLIHRCIDVSINCQLWPSSCDHSCRRVGGPDLAREYYQVPRTVGLNIQIPDTGTYPAPWWHLTPSQPLWQTMDWVKESFDVTAIGHYLRSHPWDHTQNNENIRMAFRAPGMQIIQITPQHWGAEGTKCDADGTAREGNITWLNYPTADIPEWLDPDDPNYDAIAERHQSIYQGLYQYYSDRPVHVFVANNEAGWQIYGKGCRERDECYLPPNSWCLQACGEGTLDRDDATPDDATCKQACCDIIKRNRAAYLLREWNLRQAAAEKARADHPGAALKVWHTVEVVLYGTEPWQFLVPLCDVIPRMPSPPDFVSLSGLGMVDDPVAALHFAMQCTGLPSYRFYVGESGRKITKGDQYEYIYGQVDSLFEEGVAFALIWALNTEMSYEPNWRWSVIDPITHEWRGGMYAIQDLNEKWETP